MNGEANGSWHDGVAVDRPWMAGPGARHRAGVPPRAYPGR